MTDLTAYDLRKIVIAILFTVGVYIVFKSLWSTIRKVWNRNMTWKDAARTAGIVPLGLTLMFIPAILLGDSFYISPMPVPKPGEPTF